MESKQLNIESVENLLKRLQHDDNLTVLFGDGDAQCIHDSVCQYLYFINHNNPHASHRIDVGPTVNIPESLLLTRISQVMTNCAESHNS
ncbi:MAG: hypothetical protein MI864_14305 [Pseudomonadales bacterium]|nr:hypothetical protein [Pseudomonadales bacterium]